MARWTPDPSFYPSPWQAAAGPAGDARLRGDAQHRHQRRPGAGRAHRARPRAGVADLRAARRPARHARDRRRAAPLRLERLLLRAVPVGAAPARRAPLPARARGCARRGSTSSTSRTTRTTPKIVKVDRAGGDRPQGRLQPPAHGPLRPRRDLRLRARQPRRATARAASSCSTTTTSPSRARGRTTAARRSWPTTSGGTSASTPCSPASGARRTWSRTASIGELLLGNKYGHQLHVWDLKKRRHTPGDRPRRRSTRWCSSCARPTTSARPTGSSASSPPPPTCRPRSGCGSAATTAG